MLRPVDNSRSTPAPPRKLGPDGQRLWQAIAGKIEAGDVVAEETLAAAAEALDRAAACRKKIDADGETVETGSGVFREHPLLKFELQNRAFAVRTMARLHFVADDVT